MLKKTVRQNLLDTIRSKRLVTVNELSRALHMTPANARHHLRILEDQMVVEKAGVRPARGKGRPSNLYSLSRQVRGNNLELLAGSLLDELLEGVSGEERQNRLSCLAERMHCQGIESNKGKKSTPLSQRLNQAIDRLEVMNYQPRWEAHAEAPHVIFMNCPYQAILERHPELCQIDVRLLERILEKKVIQSGKLIVDARGGVCCIFKVNVGA
jgi:predicted ArsR family transcriptional regulator